MWVLLLPMAITAAPVDPIRAKAAVDMFVSADQGSKLCAGTVTWQLAHTAASRYDSRLADYYVFNASDASAFIIVAGDDRDGVILGWGNGALDPGNAPDGLLWLLDQYRQQSEYLHTHPDYVPARRTDLKADGSAGPLLSSKWGQRTPYRDQCPTIDGKNCVTGCVATAMAQVMYYWKYPLDVPELPAYKTNGTHIQVPALPSATLDWDNMLDEYHEGQYSEQQGAAVARLMRYCGQATKMNYGIASSSSWVGNELDALKLFGYSDADSVYHSGYNDEEWETMMRDQLSLGCPIIYDGSGSNGSHNFVVDGYDGDKYSINWGWDGYNNGYFRLGSFSVYNDAQVMIIGVRPEVVQGFEFTVDGVHYSKVSFSTVKVTRASTGDNDYQGDITIPAAIEYMGVRYEVGEIGAMAFAGSPLLREVVIEPGVKKIGSGAFEGCTGLQRVVLPQNVTNLGSHLFNGCSSLTSVILPDGLTQLNSSMFKDCSSLTDLSLPLSLTSIGASAFAGCTGLSTITLPVGVTAIGEGAFAGCTSLMGISLPEAVTSLGPKAFMDCSGMSQITFPGSAIAIGEDAFMGCTSLERVDAATLAAWCGTYFANGCANPLSTAARLHVDDTLVTELVIPEGLTTISSYAFYGGSSFTSVTFPKSLTKVGQSAFAGCDNLARVNAADVGSWCRIQFVDTLANPLCIVKHLCVGGQEVTELEIPEGVTSIGDYAFNRATSLISVSIPSTAQTIGKRAFYGTAMDEIFCLASTPPEMNGSQAFSASEYQNAFLRVPGTSRERYRSDERWGQFANILPVKPDFEVDGFTYAHLEDNCVEISYVKPAILDSLMVIPDTITYKDVQYTVTSIGAGVFYGRNMIVEVDIPATIRSIGEDAFKECTHLQRVNLHDIGAWCGVELANEYSNPVTVASDMTVDGVRVTSLIIPDGVTAVNDRAFDRCNQLRDVYLPASMASIGSRAFANISLYNVICISAEPPVVKNSNAFTNYYNATLYVLESALEAYQNHDIWKRFRVKETIANDIEQDGMFYSLIDDRRVSLSYVAATSTGRGVVIPATIIRDGVQYTVAGIGPRAFKNRKDIVSIDIPTTVTTIGQDAFYGCDSLRQVNIHDVVAWSQMDIAGISASPLSCSHHLYLDGKEVTEVILPDNITRVGNYAFSSCYGLKTVSLGNGVRNIGAGAFVSCLYMDSLSVGRAVREIGGKAFGGCRGLRRINVDDPAMWALIRFADSGANPFCEGQALMYSRGEWVYMLEIPDTVSAINDYAFYGCYGLSYISIPPSVKAIGIDAFYGCYYLQRLYISDVVAWCGIDFKDYDSYPFMSSARMLYQYEGANCDLFVNDELVTNLVIPSSLREIPKYAFAGFTGLKSVKLDSGVEKIGEHAFYQCYGLETVDFGHTLKTIGGAAFRECFSLDNIVIPNSVTDIQEGAFIWCKGMTNVQLPRAIKRLNTGTFGSCQRLVEVVIPDQVTYIGPGSFNYCYSLRRVTIGSCVDTIASANFQITFDQCNSLEEVICRAAVPPVLYSNAFNPRGYVQATLYVPNGSVEAYKTANEWKRFETIIGIDIEPENPADVNGDGEVNIADVNAVIDAILAGWNDMPHDVNGDGEVNIADVNAVIDVIMLASRGV